MHSIRCTFIYFWALRGVVCGICRHMAPELLWDRWGVGTLHPAFAPANTTNRLVEEAHKQPLTVRTASGRCDFASMSGGGDHA